RPARPVERPQTLPRHHFWGAMCKFVRTKPLGAAGAAIIVLMALTAVCADLIAPYDVYEINQQLQFAPPSLAHWLGTDEFGRDVRTRLLSGARIALLVIPRMARFVRGNALPGNENVDVEAARAVGSSHLRVVWWHNVPSVMAPFLIVVTAQLGSALLTEASLSFLGLGAAQPTPS